MFKLTITLKGATMVEKKKNVLIIAKGKVIQCLLKRYMEKAGYKTVIVCNGSEALAKLCSDEVDIVLWDFDVIQLKDIQHEIEIINQIKNQFGIPLIVVIDVYEKAAFSKSINIPTDDYLVKPFKAGELASKIATKLSKKD